MQILMKKYVTAIYLGSKPWDVMAEILFYKKNECEWDYLLKIRLWTGNAIIYFLFKIFLPIDNKKILPIYIHTHTTIHSYISAYVYVYISLSNMCMCI